jgi:spermidine synthase
MTNTPTTHSPPSWLWRPHLIVFLSSACIMVLELVVGRVMASHIGMSLYTWTIVISVVLAGISLGNSLGGQLADRWASPRLLGGVFILGGIASMTLLALDLLGRLSILETTTSEYLLPILGWIAFAVILCFLPCVILGTISPIVTKLTVQNLDNAGRAVGYIYAAGSVGSIAGTFATGFLLISWLGTHAVVWGVGVLLFFLGTLFFLGRRWQLTLLPLLLVVAGTVVASSQGWLEGFCTRETNYYCIKVREEERSGRPVRVLTLDRLVHSYSSLDDPTMLVYGYERSYAEAAAYQAARKDHLRALFIGGGGYTFPRYMEEVYPGSDIQVIEIDPGVTEIAHDMLGLSRDTQVVTYNEDARMFLHREPTAHYDLIFGDAFNDYSVPYHLTTKEFNDRVHAWLADDGLYVVNIIDGPWGYFLRAYTHTLRQTFRHVYLAMNVESWRQSTRSTLVLIATDTPLELGALQSIDAGDGDSRLARSLLTENEIDGLLAEGPTMLLTDQYAPVDQMLVPVFLDQVPR